MSVQHALIPVFDDPQHGPGIPALIAGAGDRAAWRFVEFFTVNIRNHTVGARSTNCVLDSYSQVCRPDAVCSGESQVRGIGEASVSSLAIICLPFPYVYATSPARMGPR